MASDIPGFSPARGHVWGNGVCDHGEPPSAAFEAAVTAVRFDTGRLSACHLAGAG